MFMVRFTVLNRVEQGLDIQLTTLYLTEKSERVYNSKDLLDSPIAGEKGLVPF